MDWLICGLYDVWTVRFFVWLIFGLVEYCGLVEWILMGCSMIIRRKERLTIIETFFSCRFTPSSLSSRQLLLYDRLLLVILRRVEVKSAGQPCCPENAQ